MALDADRLRACLRRLHQEGLSFPWFDCSQPYDLGCEMEAQAKWLNTQESRWQKPDVSLDEFLNRARGDSCIFRTGKPPTRT